MRINPFALATAAMLSATPAVAQAAHTPPIPPSSDPDGEAQDYETTGGLARPRDIVVTATRSGDAEPVGQVPASVTLLDAPVLEQRQTRIVSDILRDVPGVAVSRAGGIGGLTQVLIRGS